VSKNNDPLDRKDAMVNDNLDNVVETENEDQTQTETTKPVGPTGDQLAMLGALQNHSLYGGTVDPYEVARRRAANKRARRSRIRNSIHRRKGK
jgi:hypothetical protein